MKSVYCAVRNEMSYGDIRSIFFATKISNMAIVQIFKVTCHNFQVVNTYTIEKYA